MVRLRTKLFVVVAGLFAVIGAAACSEAETSSTLTADSDAHVSRDDEHNGHRHSHDGGHSHAHNHTNDHDGVQGHGHLHPAHDPDAPCTCESAMLTNGWCRQCNVGYVAGHLVESALLFETLDPHGHEIDLDALACGSCRQAQKHDGFCESCGMGFINGLTYFTALTHALATGDVTRVNDVACPACRVNASGSGWCADCARGHVGNVSFADRDAYSRAASEFAVLQRAIAHVPTCEICACAMVVYRSCPHCLISYDRDAHEPASNAAPQNADEPI